MVDLILRGWVCKDAGMVATLAQATADSVLSPYVYVFYIAFIVGFVFTPIMRAVALHYGIIDRPDLVRKLHKEPVAYLGGVAVFLGWLCGLALSQFINLHRAEYGLASHVVITWSIVLGGCLIVALGLWDDIVGVRPRVKIATQIFSAVMLLVSGIGTRSIWPILEPIDVRLKLWMGLSASHAPLIPDWIIVSLSSLAVIFLVVACCNATNLMDGLDGLCGGVTAIIVFGFLFVAVHLAMFGGALNSNLDGMRIVLALALLGAVLGFIPYNFNPASIFMGDTGSMFLGFCCAVLIILMGEGQHPKWFLASTVMFALPVLDTTLAFARRWVNRRPLFSADRYHFHHQLVARGYTVKQTVFISYGLALTFAMLGAAIVYVRTRYAVGIYLVVFGSIIVAAYKMGMVHEKPRVVARRQLGAGADVEPVQSVEPGRVLEVRDEDVQRIGSSIGESNSPRPTSTPVDWPRS